MKNILVSIFSVLTVSVFAQNTYVPLDKSVYDVIDRYEIKNGEFSPGLFTNYKGYKRVDVVNLVDSLKADTSKFTKVDRFNLEYLLIDNWQVSNSEKEISKKPFLKHFYKTKSDLYSINTKHFQLRANPVLYWQGGKASGQNKQLYTNTRGIQIEGQIDERIGFYTFMADNQVVMPTYVGDRVRSYQVVPGQGFWKGIKDKKNGYDFFTARGYLTFKISKHIDAQFGHDKNFVGNGYRSLILSDNAPNYLFLKINTQIGKFKYTNLFAEMNAETKYDAGGTIQDRVLEKKYLAFHHLSVNVFKNFNLGIFESVTFGREKRYFDLQYLNPIIFYRSVEQQVGSGDNALLGLDYRWNLLRHFQLYGQITLDEFVISHVRDGNGWWGNKQALQMGLKYIDVAGISNLDIQGEFNYIRPYTYQHKDGYTNYTHYGQSLAHPIGANTREFIALLRYQPLPRLTIKGRIIAAEFGLDSDSTNWGTNVLADYRNIEQEYGNKVGQGINTKLLKADMTVTYQLKHNLFFDFTYTVRKQDSELDALDNSTNIVSGALRLNISQREYDF